MIRTRIAQRYTKALFELAQEAGKVDEVGADLQSFHQLLQSDANLQAALLSPLLTRTARTAVMQALLEATEPHPLVANFLRVLLEARKLPCLPDIVSEFNRSADEAAGRVHGRVVTAMPLDEADLTAISEALSRALDKEVILEADQDSSILGGVVARVGNLVFDGSLRTQLQRMKDNLIKG